MTNVFISYERSAEVLARKIRDVLKLEGHSVWTDAELPPHRSYSDVIEERLEIADAVVVLWSEAACRSQWVRAEAEFARERGKLVQLSMDGSTPPMPFTQIQCAQLKGWNGDRQNPNWRRIVESIEHLGEPSKTVVHTHAGPAARASVLLSSMRNPLAWGAVAVMAIAGAAGGWFAWSGLYPKTAATHEARVAVLPFEALSRGQDARFFTDGLSDQIITTLSNNKIPVVSHDDAAGLRGPGRAARLKALGVGLLLDGAVQNDGKTVRVSVHIEDGQGHAAVWSGGIEGPADTGPALQMKLANLVVGVVACSNRALAPVHGLTDPELLSRYLRACELFVSHDGDSLQANFEMLNDLRIVTAGAPDFAPAHSDLAKFDGYLAPIMPADQRSLARIEAAKEADRALSIDPHSADAYLAREELLPPTSWADREAMLRKGVALNPEWPHTNGFLAKLLAEMGRLQEAQVYAQRAAAADLQIDWGPFSTVLVCAAGQAADQIEPLRRQFAAQPADPDSVKWALKTCLTDAGRFEDARLLNDPQKVQADPDLKANDVWLKAAATRDARDIAEAKRQLLALSSAKDPDSAPYLIKSLASLGLIDEAFAIADRYVPGEPETSREAEFLFVPLTAPLRRDPRFMKLAARIGLAAFWQSSGKWPDFCTAPGLPYDCRIEAKRWVKS